MGSKCKREMRGGETYGAAIMLIRVGYDMALHFPQPTAMVLMLALHPSRASTIRQPERLEVQPDVAVRSSSILLGTAAAVMTSGQRHRVDRRMVMSRWTATRIAEHMTSLLHDTRLIVVSNREPYSHRWHRPAPLESSADTTVGSRYGALGFWLDTPFTRPGVPYAPGRPRPPLESAGWRPHLGARSGLQACHGTWVAWGSGSADRQAVDAQDHVQVPPNNPQYTLRRCG